VNGLRCIEYRITLVTVVNLGIDMRIEIELDGQHSNERTHWICDRMGGRHAVRDCCSLALSSTASLNGSISEIRSTLR